MILVDSHCHLDRLDLTASAGSLEPILAAAAANQVRHLLCVAIALEAYPAMLALVAPYRQISVSVGVHPDSQHGHDPAVAELVALAQNPKVVAIGETGLDYYHSTDPEHHARQQQRFRRHIQAAHQVNKPLIVHTRNAKADTLRILTEERAEQVGGVLHCFTEDWEMAQAALALNFYISFSGIITFKTAQALQSVAQQVPLERLLLETDSPYLAPVPFRGKPNQPAYLKQVAEAMAKLRQIPLEALAAATTRNFYTLFTGAVPHHADPL